jgi:hypothetical protein
MFSTSVTNNAISDTIKDNTYVLLLTIFGYSSNVRISTKINELIDESLVVLD